MSTKGTQAKKQLNAIIVDDDSNSRKLLNIMLKKFPQIKVVGEAATIPSALDIIREKKPDSIFLDICLGNDNGFELIEKIADKAKVVLVSGYDDYALKGFEVNALDYLMKPIEYKRLAKTISRLTESGLNGESQEQEISDAQPAAENNPILEKEKSAELISEDEEDGLFEEDELHDNNSDDRSVLEYDDRLFITSDGVSRFLKINTILCITAEKDYSYIYLLGGKKVLVLKPMVEWEQRLTPKYFVRIHRSTIVNLEFVEKVEKWFNSSYHVYIQGLSEPFQMSRRYAAKLKERFK